MKRLVLFSLVVCFMTACGSGGSGLTGDDQRLDWRFFRGDASLSGYTDLSIPKNPVLLWSFKTNMRTLSSPVVEKGTTYWSDHCGTVRGVDLQGKQVFEYDLKTTVQATPMIHDSILYLGRIDGLMTAISLAKKDTLWTYKTQGQITMSPNHIPLLNRQAIVFGSKDNFLYCVDAATGSEISKFDSGYPLSGAIAVWKKKILVMGADSWFRVISSKTCAPIDSLLLDNYIPASPAVMGDFCYIGDHSGNVYEILLEKGKITRHKKILKAKENSGPSVSVPVVTGDMVYILSGNRYLYAINRKDGKLQWKYQLKGEIGESSPVVCNDKIIACTQTGIISILDAGKGKLLWEHDAGEQIIGSPAVIKDHFLILTARGTLLCFGNK